MAVQAALCHDALFCRVHAGPCKRSDRRCVQMSLCVLGHALMPLSVLRRALMALSDH